MSSNGRASHSYLLSTGTRRQKDGYARLIVPLWGRGRIEMLLAAIRASELLRGPLQSGYELHPFAGRVGKMRCPVEIGVSERGRRKSDGEARRRRVQRPIGDVRNCRHRIGVRLPGRRNCTFRVRLGASS